MFAASLKTRPTEASAKRQARAVIADYCYPLVSQLLGSLLLAASLLKAHQQRTLFLLAPRSPERWLSSGAIALEMSLGLWLLSGFHPRWSRWIAAMCFAIFLSVSLAKGLAGEASCGCFGEVSVNPWITAGIDGLAVLTLLLARLADRFSPFAYLGRKHRLAFGLLSLLILGSVAWWIVGAQGSRLNDTDETPRLGSMIVIDPQEWIGRRLPLLSHIDNAEQLQSGSWLMVLYRRDCQSCHEQLPLLFTALRRIPLGGEHRTLVALIEVPSNSLRSSFLGNEKPDALMKLPTGPQWIVQTPLFLRVQNGIVCGAAHTAEEALR